MLNRFTWPVVVSSAFHAGLFLWTWEKTPRVAPPRIEVFDTFVCAWPREEPEEVQLFEAEAAAPKGNPEAGRPTLDEFIAVERAILEMPARELRAPVEFDGTRIVPGDWGDPMGADEWGGAPVLTAGALDRMPRTKVRVAPLYPSEARGTGLTGEVLVEFVVDETGRVLRPRVVRSTDARFEAPTLRAVEKWRFEPGTRHGVPVRFRMAVPVVFSLET
jgi:TonB family C-terminal domain